MAETLTANFGWTKPDPGASANTWGTTLNATTDKIDAAVFANQALATAGQAPIGSGAIWFTATPPTGWLLADNSSYSTAAPYDKLFAIFGTQFNQAGDAANTFRVPPLSEVFPLGAGLTHALNATGGASTVALDATMMPVHAHGVNDPTHAHGAYQNAHAHNIATGGHSHGVNDPGHAHGGVVVEAGGWYKVGTPGPQLGDGNTAASGTGISIQAVGNLGGNTDTQQPGVGVYGAATGVSIQNAGGGAAHNNMPPFLAVNFIIRYQ